MADLVDRIRKELTTRIGELRPIVDEVERLQRAAAALARTSVRSLPGLGSRPVASVEAPTATARASRKRAGSARQGARAPASGRGLAP